MLRFDKREAHLLGQLVAGSGQFPLTQQSKEISLVADGLAVSLEQPLFHQMTLPPTKRVGRNRPEPVSAKERRLLCHKLAVKPGRPIGLDLFFQGQER